MGANGLRLCINGRKEDAIHGNWLKRKGTLTLPCVGVFPRIAFYQACFQLLPPLARTFTVNNDGSTEHA